MNLVIIIFLMLIWEILFNLFIKYARYNFDKNSLITVILSLIYSSVWILCIINSDKSDFLIFVYTMGVAQGILEVAEVIGVYRKYRANEWISQSFRKNFCKIVSFNWIEEFEVEELQILQKMNNAMIGDKGRNTLVIVKEKAQDIKLMFYIYKQENWTCIQRFCEENCDIELKQENKRKQVIVCRIRSKDEQTIIQ